MEYIWHTISPLGGITLSSDGTSLTGLWFDGQAHFAQPLEADHEEKALPIFQETETWLCLYFQGKDPAFTPPLAPRGTPFRRLVWDVLRTIPRGHTITYGGIAAVLSAAGHPTSARAVGGAAAHNPILLLIPCHRVVGADGRLTGYAAGLKRKRALLRLEGANFPGILS